MTKSRSAGTTEVILPPKSATQIALEEKSLQVAEAQLEAISALNEVNQAQLAIAGPVFELQAEVLTRELEALNDPVAIERAAKLQGFQDELVELELENIKRGGAATEEQKALIGETVAQAIAAGESDISKFQETTTESLAQELAPALGLRATDTPIVDRAGRAAEEATRQQGQLVRNLRGAEASALLNFPLAANQLQSAQTQFQQSLAQSTSQFQQQLREQALGNRLQLAGGTVGQATGTGLGLSTGLGNPGALAAALGNQRVGAAGKTVSKSFTPSTLDTIGKIGQGVGAVAGAFFGASSKEFKTDKTPVDSAKALEAVKRLKVDSWRYKGQDILHLGPYAEDFKREVGTGGDGKSISLISHLGLLTAALKGLAEKVDNPLNLKAA